MTEPEKPVAGVVVDLGVPPVGTLAEQRKNFRFDLVSGILVFLIALPLCLAISIASGFPPLAGVLTAIIGGLVGATISNSELAIKGPAAGLIVIVLGCVNDFRAVKTHELEAAPAATAAASSGVDADTTKEQKETELSMAAYRMALAVGVVAAVIQIGLGLLRMGALGDFFPTSAVHGMLAAIGVIIVSKQIPVAVGLRASGSPLELIARIPQALWHMNPEIALIGAISLAILFGMPFLKSPRLRKIPGPLIVLIVAIPLGLYLELPSPHAYQFHGQDFQIEKMHLVDVPLNMIGALAYPDFSALQHPIAWKWVAFFALIASLESLISAKAVDLLDPWKRKTNLNRDLLAAGVGNLAAALIGGLPMISEIVRSRANIDNGARTRFSNLYHGLLLLICVTAVPQLLHLIPTAALAAMLIFTGFRLAHPKEFVHMFKVGPEQLVIYCITIIGVLAIDLLVGVAMGILTEWMFHWFHGASLGSMFKSDSAVEVNGDGSVRLAVNGSAVFSNWIPLRRKIVESGLAEGKSVTVDLSRTSLVDYTVMKKLHEISFDFRQQDLELTVVGLEDHRPLSNHPFSARKRALSTSAA